MTNAMTLRAKNRQYEQVIIDYCKNQGHFVCITDDSTFITLLRTMLMKQLGLGPENLTASTDPDQALRIIRDASMKYTMPVIFLERVIAGRELGFMVRQLKNTFIDLRIIMLATDANQQRLVLLHEIGADNFITKPVSINSLIEKMAFTIKPQGKLGQLVTTARTFLQQNNPQEALQVAKQILELKSNSAAAFLVIGDALRAMGKLERARDAYEEASRHAEMYLEPLHRLAEIHGEMKETDKRLYYLQRLDELSPLNVERKVDMGEIHLGLGNAETAGQLFHTAVTMAKREASTYVGDVAARVATIYEEVDPEQSEVFLRHALDAKVQFFSKDDIVTFNRLGILLRQQGKWSEATQEYKKALAIAPDDENLYYNMGMACAEGRNFREAHAHMLKALSLNAAFPGTAGVIGNNMAIIFSKNGDSANALKCVRAALETEPDYAPAMKTLQMISKSTKE